MFLSNEVFKTVVENSPLISIDLIVENSDGQFLLGMRTNRPAQNTWFVPGGRVQKGESLVNAFVRLCKGELNLDIERQNSQFLGLFEHFYEDSVFGDGISTHYIVMAHKVKVNQQLLALPSAQHNAYKWMSQSEILASDSVHIHTKWYFD